MSETTETVERSRTDLNWEAKPLRDLTAHIRAAHHQYVRAETVRIRELAAKIASKHGGERPEFRDVQAVFEALADELLSHMMKEEMMLFPYIERLEEAAAAKARAPFSPFGTVRNPVAMMRHEHADAQNALNELRRLTGGYAGPAGSCECPQTLYQALAEFDADLEQHIHLENDILFPRAVELEQQL